MLTTFYFIEPIAHGVEKIAVGVDDDAVWLKLDDRKGAVQRFEYRFLRHEQVMLQGHIGGDFNDFADLAILADREVGCFQPDFLAVLADSLEGTLLTVAIGQLPPEFPIGGESESSFRQKMAWCCPTISFEAVADGAEKQRAGIEDMALGVNSIMGDGHAWRGSAPRSARPLLSLPPARS